MVVGFMISTGKLAQENQFSICNGDCLFGLLVAILWAEKPNP
jgi:hypothetical protein